MICLLPFCLSLSSVAQKRKSIWNQGDLAKEFLSLYCFFIKTNWLNYNISLFVYLMLIIKYSRSVCFVTCSQFSAFAAISPVTSTKSLSRVYRNIEKCNG